MVISLVSIWLAENYCSALNLEGEDSNGRVIYMFPLVAAPIDLVVTNGRSKAQI